MIAYTVFRMCLTHKFNEDAQRVKDAWKFKVNTWQDANRKVLGIQQQMLIAGMKDKNKNETSNVKLNYGEMIANLVYYLKITPYDMTVAQFRAHENQVNKLTAKK